MEARTPICHGVALGPQICESPTEGVEQAHCQTALVLLLEVTYDTLGRPAEWDLLTLA